MTHFNMDFSAARAPSGRAGLLILLAGAVLAAGACHRWLDAGDLRAAEQQSLLRLQQAQQRLARPASTLAARTRTATADARAQADLAGIAAALHRPWWPLLDAVELRVGPSTQVMQLGVEPSFKTAQLQVQARTLNDVLRLVQGLDGAAPQLRAAQLVGHEWVGGGDTAAAVPRQVVARIVLTLDGGAGR